MKAIQIKRVFKYNGIELQDPNPNMTPESVCAFQANFYPELKNAAVEGPVTKNGVSTYTFARAVGSKGAVTASALCKKLQAVKPSVVGAKVQQIAHTEKLVPAINAVVKKRTCESRPLSMPSSAFGMFG